MRTCLSCGDTLQEDQFPAMLSLVCTLCTKARKGAAGLNVNTTHSHPIKPHPVNIAKQLLKRTPAYRDHAGGLRINEADPSDRGAAILDRAQTMLDDDRPLIDIMHEATFNNDVGIDWIKDKYEFRMLLRKAHCFTLDAETSAMVADFSVAIAKDLAAARQMAFPPFPVTWIEIDNLSRNRRMVELGLLPAGADVVARIGWLIHPAVAEGGFYATYGTVAEEGVLLAPLSYWWHCGSDNSLPVKDLDNIELMCQMAFGMNNTNVHPYDAFPTTTRMHGDILRRDKDYMRSVKAIMMEMRGELRHIWGFLIALGAGHLGVETRIGEAKRHDGPLRTMKNGKPLLPLEHKLLHLHLAKRATVDKVVARAISHHKNRRHEVRAHFRTYRNKEDGSVRMRIPIPSHPRGDERIGKIEKTYKVEK